MQSEELYDAIMCELLCFHLTLVEVCGFVQVESCPGKLNPLRVMQLFTSLVSPCLGTWLQDPEVHRLLLSVLVFM